jgi:hypothetical protein
METGTFKAVPKSLEGKWFAENPEHAHKWGKLFEGPGQYRVVIVDIPEDVANSLFRIKKLDKIGPARYAELDKLTQAIIVGEVP